MKKPKTIIGMASPHQAMNLECLTGALTITLTEADFKRIWKLAREAIHFNQATRVPYGQRD